MSKKLYNVEQVTLTETGTGPIQRTCRQCGRPFPTRRHNADYCSPRCRQAKWRTANPNLDSTFHKALGQILDKPGGAKELSRQTGISPSCFTHYRRGEYPGPDAFKRLVGPLSAACNAPEEMLSAWRKEVEAAHRDQIATRWSARRTPAQPKGIKFIGTTIFERLVSNTPRGRAGLAGVLNFIPKQKVAIHLAAGNCPPIERTDHIPTTTELLTIVEREHLGDDVRIYVQASRPQSLSLGVYSVEEIRQGAWPIGDDWADRIEVGLYHCVHCNCPVIVRRSLVDRWRFCSEECRSHHHKPFPDPVNYPTLRAYFNAAEVNDAITHRGLSWAEVCRRANANTSTITWLKSGFTRAMERQTSDAIADVLEVNRYALWSIREVSAQRRATGHRLQERGFGPQIDASEMRAARGKQDTENRRQAAEFRARMKHKTEGNLASLRKLAILYGPGAMKRLAGKALQIRWANANIRHLDKEENEVRNLTDQLDRAKQLKQIAQKRVKLSKEREDLLSRLRAKVNENAKQNVIRLLIDNPDCNVAQICREHGFDEHTGRVWLSQLRRAGLIPYWLTSQADVLPDDSTH